MKKQNLIKKIMIALAVFIISIQTVNANENKTITPKELLQQLLKYQVNLLILLVVKLRRQKSSKLKIGKRLKNKIEKHLN